MAQFEVAKTDAHTENAVYSGKADRSHSTLDIIQSGSGLNETQDSAGFTTNYRQWPRLANERPEPCRVFGYVMNHGSE